MPTPKQFIEDVQLEGCKIFVGETNFTDDELTPDTLEAHLKAHGKQNRYINTGVRPDAPLVRISDTDVIKKNHIFFDFDLKTEHPEITEEEIKQKAEDFKNQLEGSPFENWRYIVFTGSGLHIHYFCEGVIENLDNRKVAAGYKKIMRELQKEVGEKADPACSNISRLVRLPGSWNSKGLTRERWGKPVKTEILHYQDTYCKFENIMEVGKKELEKEKKIAKEKAEESLGKFSSIENSAYVAINNIPISKLMASLKGWETNGRNFNSPGKTKLKACYVPEDENYLVDGGTDHILGPYEGYNCFTLVRHLECEGDNRATFEWFKKKFPDINDISRKEFKEHLEEQEVKKKQEEAQEKMKMGNVIEVFNRLKDFNFEFLKTGLRYADENKWLIRGAVTRIGAASSIGKSTFTYWLTHHLLKEGHKGVIISSEVQSPLVLANMLKVKNEWDFWDILKHESVPSEEDLEFYKNLWVFDSLTTKNKMKTIRPLAAEIKPDFVIIDFLQGIKPSEEGGSAYEKLTNYAFEVQSMAQELGASVIDLSQISNLDMKAVDAKTDPIDRLNLVNFKGSGDLYSSADVCLMLDRNKTADEDAEFNPNYFGIRMSKHKYMDTGYTFLKSSFETGRFTLAQSTGVNPETGWQETTTF